MMIDKVYNPKNFEKRIYNNWVKKGYFTPKISKGKKPFTILIPPPNVTGILHMGHVLNNTLQDITIRFKRMQQYAALWIPGTDHAGIATQNVVEKELLKEGLSRHDLGREKLIERIWKWKEEKGGTIIEQLKQLGCSCDWSRERFTMDEGLSEAVKEVFVSLYEKGLLYRGKYIINWCTRCHTALANDEVEHFNEKGKFWYIKYPFADEEGGIIIATTRPETMFADTAVAVHPKDERYKNIIGKKIKLPLTDRIIPIISDHYVDKDKGTGCVKITPAHDPNDYEVGLRHNLPQPIVIDENGFMTDFAGKDFVGLSKEEAREKVVLSLKEKGFLIKEVEIEHQVGHCYRCNTVIEPYLSDQWFVKMKPLAKPAIEKVINKEINFQPKRWTKVYLHWMENVRDWCISRQIWWGHRIPAYYCENCGEMIVSKISPEKCPKCNCQNFKQDENVLDTWFSSALWPFSTMGWPKETEDLAYFLPTNILITAPEIIYLWVARMIMTTLEFKQKIPFDTVLLHGIVRDDKGQKMSKSLGNSPDPLKIIDEVGADSLRFAIIFHTPKGEDSFYSEKILESGKNFCNKIYNAFRFILMNVENIKGMPNKNEIKLELADKWIYSKLNQTIKSVSTNYEKLRYNDVASTLMDFFWNDFCSWYIELAKDRINSEIEEEKLTVKYVLLDIFQTSMKLLHPLIPFITEELWQNSKEFMASSEESLVIAKFPVADNSLIDKKINENMQLIQAVITNIRNMKKQVNMSLGKEIELWIKVAEESQINLFKEYEKYLKKLVKVENLKIAINLEKPKTCLISTEKNLEIYLPLKGDVDLDKEREKLNKKIEKLEKEFTQIKNKLSNKQFVENAPSEIIEKEKSKYEEVLLNLNSLKTALKNLEE